MKKFALLVLIGTAMIFGVYSCKKDSPVRVEKNHRKSTGASANNLLSDEDYTSLVVEIQYMTGFRPSDVSMSRLMTFLNERLNKPDGINFVYKEIGAQNKSSYSIDDVRAIEDANRTEFTTKKKIATYFLFLDGEFSGNSGNSKVLGAAYYNTSMVVFEKTVRDLTGGFGEPETDKLETVVINHEFGHILGLVNLGTAMQTFHQDTEHGAHCDNDDCLMNWTAETGDAISNLIGNTPIPGLDQNCIKDLQSNGGK